MSIETDRFFEEVGFLQLERLMAKLDPIPPPLLRTSKDVRFLTVCPTCKQLGDVRHMVERHDVYQHGRCFVKVWGISALRALPKGRTDGLTLGDLGADLMRELLESR